MCLAVGAGHASSAGQASLGSLGHPNVTSTAKTKLARWTSMRCRAAGQNVNPGRQAGQAAQTYPIAWATEQIKKLIQHIAIVGRSGVSV